MFKFKNKSLIFYAVFVSLLLSLPVFTPKLKSPVLSILKYPLDLFTLIRREVGGIIFYHQNLTQIERLKKERDLLKQRLNTLNEANLENKRLEKLLFLKQKTAFKVVASRGIGRSPDSWSSVIIIDKGRLNGINTGMTAINYLGFLGRVIEAGHSTSKIMLVNDPDLSVSSIDQRSRQEGLVSGTLGNLLIMKYLPKDCDIKVSDVVVTSGLNDNYPKGLLIGIVQDVGEEFSGLTRYAIIKPAANLSSIEEVLIVIP